MLAIARRQYRNERGATTSEYAFAIAFVALIAVAAMPYSGIDLSALLVRVGRAVAAFR